MSEKLDQAIALSTLGFKVFACYWITQEGTCSCSLAGDCKSPGKHPLTPQGVKNATCRADRIMAWWQRWPEANVALATGAESGVFAVDIDRRSDKDGMLWYDAISSELPDGPKQITPSGGLHLLFAYPATGKIKQSSDAIYRGVDVRSDNGYIIVEPSSHVSGQYMWEDHPLEFEAPPAPQWLLDRVTTEAPEIIRETSQGASKWRISLPIDNARREELEDAVRWIDPDSRDTWLRVGMAIHSEHANETGYEIWTEWSSQSSKFSPRDQRYTWDRFDSYGGIAVSTVFYMAKAAGWPGLKTEDVAVKPYEGAGDTGEFPNHLLEVDGLLWSLTDWINASSLRRQPVLALAAAITACGTLYGRRFCSQTGLRTNTYNLGVAKSGHGKDHARACIKRLFARAEVAQLLGGEDVSSGTAIIKALSVMPVQLFLIDEIGELLKKVMGDRAAGFEKDVVSTLLRLYSSANTTFRGREMAAASRMDIEEPCGCVYGTTTPLLYESFGSGTVSGGLLSRMLFFNVSGDRPNRQTDMASMEPPQALIDATKLAAGITPTTVMQHVATVAPTVVTIPDGPGVNDVWLRLEKIANRHSDSRAAELWARVEEQAARLALIRALSAGRRSVTLPDAEWGAEVAVWCVSGLAREVESRAADSKAERNVKLVLSVVRRAYPGWVTLSQVTRHTHRLARRERQETLETLVESGLVMRKKEGRKTMFVACSPDDEGIE